MYQSLVKIHWRMLILVFTRMLNGKNVSQWPWPLTLKINRFQIFWRTKYVPSLVKIHWRMLILECSQGCYGRTDGSVTISFRNFVGEGITSVTQVITGATSRAGTAYPYGAHEFIPGFLCDSYCSILSILCFVFVLFFWSLYCLSFFQLPLLITSLASSKIGSERPIITATIDTTTNLTQRTSLYKTDAAILCRPFGLLATRFGFPFFHYEWAEWWLFQKCVLHTKLDIYEFIHVWNGQVLWLQKMYLGTLSGTTACARQHCL
jgi:hypothetical protein